MFLASYIHHPTRLIYPLCLLVCVCNFSGKINIYSDFWNIEDLLVQLCVCFFELLVTFHWFSSSLHCFAHTKWLYWYVWWHLIAFIQRMCCWRSVIVANYCAYAWYCCGVTHILTVNICDAIAPACVNSAKIMEKKGVLGAWAPSSYYFWSSNNNQIGSGFIRRIITPCAYAACFSVCICMERNVPTCMLSWDGLLFVCGVAILFIHCMLFCFI